MSTSVDQKLTDLSKTSNNQFIFRVHQSLRKENEEAYESQMISIGPYHHGKENLKKMEKYKLKYLQGILKRRGESSAERYIAALREFEEEARDCYAEPFCMSSQDFLEMMVLDGSFIIEFLRKTRRIVEILKDDHIFSMGWYHPSLSRDLLLFENQLPFFILMKLFGMTRIKNRRDDQLIFLSIFCLKDCFGANASYAINQPRNKNFHLLRLMHESWFSSFSKPTVTKEEGGCQSICIEIKKRLHSRKEQGVQDPKKLEAVESVCELKEYGIKFEREKQSESCLDIKFENGIMKIPNLTVDDRTERTLRNLIAYEQYITVIAGSSRKIVTDYATFLDCLINSSKDVQVLCDKKIIKNWLGSNEEVSNMINKICINVSFSSKQFSYKKIFMDVNKHCSRRRHRWIADLKKKYFYNPWAIISFLAAIILLLLTLVQTIFSVL